MNFVRTTSLSLNCFLKEIKFPAELYLCFFGLLETEATNGVGDVQLIWTPQLSYIFLTLFNWKLTFMYIFVFYIWNKTAITVVGINYDARH